MKRLFLPFAALASLLLPGCLSFSSKDDSYQPRLFKTAISRDSIVSYSVSFADDTYSMQGSQADNRLEKGWFEEEDACNAVREALKGSKMFRAVYHAADGAHPSSVHLHFSFEASGPMSQAAEALFYLTVYCCPTPVQTDVHGTLSVMVNGREVDCYHTKWDATSIYSILFLPVTPLAANRSSLADDMVEDLLEQLKANVK